MRRLDVKNLYLYASNRASTKYNRGEVLVLLLNAGNEPVTLSHGERMAQLVIAPVARARFELTETLDDTVRGAGGFGSTGRGP